MNKNLEPFFVEDTKQDCVRFIGDKLECYIPTRYENYGYLKIGRLITSLGIFKMVVNGKIEGGLQIPALITIEANNTYNATIDGKSYLVVEVIKGSKLLCHLDLIQINMMGYHMWNEFLNLGNIPKYLEYNEAWNLFDDCGEFTGKGVSGNHAVLEMIFAHVFRDPNDLRVKYRHTNMKDHPAAVSLRNVSYGPTSTSAKIFGSYAEEGINSALLNQSEENYELEDIFRK